MKSFILSLLFFIAINPAFAQVQPTADTARVKDTVPVKGTISGKVTAMDGAPIVDAEVYVYNIDDIIGSATTDSAGNYTTNRMVIGTYRVWVKSKGYIRKSIDNIPVQAWQDTKLDITLSPFISGSGKTDIAPADAVNVTATPLKTGQAPGPALTADPKATNPASGK